MYSRGTGLARRPVRRHLEVLQVEARDLLERGCRDEAAPDGAPRLVDRDEDDESGPRGGNDPHERRDVTARGIPTVRIRLLRRSRLAGDLVAGDGRVLARALGQDVLEHRHELAG